MAAHHQEAKIANKQIGSIQERTCKLEQNGDQGSLFDKNLFDSGHPTHHHGTGGVEYEESHP